MKTITIQIGNTDDKLTQEEWASFVGTISALLEDSNASIHFFGAPPNYERWQNAAWVFVAEDWISEQAVKSEVVDIRKLFKQSYLAWTEGVTEFI